MAETKLKLNPQLRLTFLPILVMALILKPMLMADADGDVDVGT